MYKSVLATNRTIGTKYPTTGSFSCDWKEFIGEMIADVTEKDVPPIVIVHIGGNHFNAIIFIEAGQDTTATAALPAQHTMQVQQDLYKYFGTNAKKPKTQQVEPDTDATMKTPQKHGGPAHTELESPEIKARLDFSAEAQDSPSSMSVDDGDDQDEQHDDEDDGNCETNALAVPSPLTPGRIGQHSSSPR